MHGLCLTWLACLALVPLEPPFERNANPSCMIIVQANLEGIQRFS